MIPDYIKVTENNHGAGCVIFTDVHYTSGLYADPSPPSIYGYRANLSITTDDGRTYSDEVRARKMRADILAPNDPKNLGCQFPCLGERVNPAVGNAYVAETDISAAGNTPLTWRRSYNSGGSTQQSALGARWMHDYSRRLTINALAVPPSVTAYRPDGRVLVFALLSGSYKPDADINDRLTQVGSGWQYKNADSEDVETYDAAGALSGVTDRLGRTTTISYSDGSASGSNGGTYVRTTTPLSAGLLRHVADAFGRQITLDYDTSNRIVVVTTSAGQTIGYTYFPDTGLLSSVTFPGSATKQLIYNESAYTGGNSLPSALTGIIDENGTRHVAYTFDSQMRPIATERAGGVSRYTFSYVAPTISTVYDPSGTGRNFGFQKINWTLRNSSVSQNCGQCGGPIASSTTYDTAGNVTSRADFNNKIACFAFDLTRNLETARAEGILSTETCSTVMATLPVRADVRKVSTQWHPIWRLPTKIAEPNRITTSAYNGDGSVYCAPTTALVGGNPIGVLCKKTVQETTDATGQLGLAAAVTGSARVWQHTYDSYGQVLTATDPNGMVTTTTYYAATDPDLGKRGNVQTITNPLGHVTTITAYDLNGRPTSITDPNGAVTTLTYHPRGWLTSRAVGGETTTYDYDGVGQMTKATQPDGSYIQYTYDGAHRLTQIQDGLGNKIVYTLDAMGKRVIEQAYDPSGTLARTRQQVFDSLNRLHQSVGAQ